MAKRIATNELNDRNWDQEEDEEEVRIEENTFNVNSTCIILHLLNSSCFLSEEKMFCLGV